MEATEEVVAPVVTPAAEEPKSVEQPTPAPQEPTAPKKPRKFLDFVNKIFFGNDIVDDEM